MLLLILIGMLARIAIVRLPVNPHRHGRGKLADQKFSRSAVARKKFL
jgi:hypothetical protein